MKTFTRMKAMRLEVELIKQVEKMAKKENRNFTNMVQHILKQAVI